MLDNRILEYQLNLTPDELLLVERVHGPDFSWYYQEATRNYKFFGHVLLTRSKDAYDQTAGKVNSQYFAPALEVFNRFCKETGTAYTKVLRGCFNLTTYFAESHSDIHLDHPFPHKVFLLYLNDCTGGETCFFDSQGSLIHTIAPAKFKGIVFDGMLPHAIKSCAPSERRIVLVFTFI